MTAKDMTDADLRQWVQNDEGLYLWWQWTGIPLRSFVTAEREQIRAVIDNILSGRKPAHYLCYGR